jgi:ADP-ribose pyrophosphatase
MPLPPLPRHAIEVVETRVEGEADAFLRLRRWKLRARFADGQQSEPFAYDTAERTRLDAVVIAAHYRDPAGHRMVFLRSALRPPVALRGAEHEPARGLPASASSPPPGGLWELPAGLVEADERTPEGIRRCAARELGEEVGLVVDPASVAPLGPSGFPAPGMIGERHFFFHVEVDPAARGTPTEDGSALEQQAVIAAIEVEEAIVLCRSGVIEDEKTEIGLRRLAEL